MSKRTGRESLMGYLSTADLPPSDQRRGLPQPPLELPIAPNARLFDLPPANETTLKRADLTELIESRVSRRRWRPEGLCLAELSYLLWATQGVKQLHGEGYCTLRTVPSAGARHAFETYLALADVKGLPSGFYRYLALSHRLELLREEEGFAEALAQACCGQVFCGTAPALFAWACVPYRMEWRYGQWGHRGILLDAGHVCQNLYLACEALGLGTCAIAAYFQEELDGLFGLDGNEVFVCYLAPVGRPHGSED